MIYKWFLDVLLTKSKELRDCQRTVSRTVPKIKCTLSLSQIHVIETCHVQLDSSKDFLALLLAVQIALHKSLSIINCARCFGYIDIDIQVEYRYIDKICTYIFTFTFGSIIYNHFILYLLSLTPFPALFCINDFESVHFPFQFYCPSLPFSQVQASPVQTASVSLSG